MAESLEIPMELPLDEHDVALIAAGEEWKRNHGDVGRLSFFWQHSLDRSLWRLNITIHFDIAGEDWCFTEVIPREDFYEIVTRVPKILPRMAARVTEMKRRALN